MVWRCPPVRRDIIFNVNCFYVIYRQVPFAEKKVLLGK